MMRVSDMPQTATAQETNMPALDRLPAIADELDRIGNYIEGFLDRCNGVERPEEPKLREVTSGHIGQIGRVQDALHRVDCLARDLQKIG